VKKKPNHLFRNFWVEFSFFLILDLIVNEYGFLIYLEISGLNLVFFF